MHKQIKEQRRNQVIAGIKQENVRLGLVIKKLKDRTKELMRADAPAKEIDRKRRSLSKLYRCRHVALGQLLGKKREDIEQPDPFNHICEPMVQQLTKIWEYELRFTSTKGE